MSFSKQKLLLTREELFARVWSLPLVQLARQFGISDVALGRMCRRRNIPCPPPGYWAKYRAGRPPPKPPLPPPLGKISRPALFTLASTSSTPSTPERMVPADLTNFNVEQLLAAADGWDRLDRLRRYTAACERRWKAQGPLLREHREWLSWARREVASMACRQPCIPNFSPRVPQLNVVNA